MREEMRDTVLESIARVQYYTVSARRGGRGVCCILCCTVYYIGVVYSALHLTPSLSRCLSLLGSRTTRVIRAYATSWYERWKGEGGEKARGGRPARGERRGGRPARGERREGGWEGGWEGGGEGRNVLLLSQLQSTSTPNSPFRLSLSRVSLFAHRIARHIPLKSGVTRGRARSLIPRTRPQAQRGRRGAGRGSGGRGN